MCFEGEKAIKKGRNKQNWKVWREVEVQVKKANSSAVSK
jgi:hypothetical protein